MPRWLLLIGIILIVVLPIMLIVHLLSPTSGLVLRLLAVVVVLALGLREFVDFSACEAGEQFFGELVGDGLSYEGGSVPLPD